MNSTELRFKVGDRITDGYGIAEVIEVTEEGMRIDWLGETCCPNLPPQKYNFPSGKGCWYSWQKDQSFVGKLGLYYPEIFSVGSQIELIEAYFNRPQGSTGTVLALPDPEHSNSPHCMFIKWDEKQRDQPSQELVPIRYLKSVVGADISLLDDALLYALNADAPTWERLRDTGASDVELKDAIASAFGIASGSNVPLDWSAKGGKNPQFWTKIAAIKTPNLEGNALIKKVRSLLAIPNPCVGAGSNEAQNLLKEDKTMVTTTELARTDSTQIEVIDSSITLNLDDSDADNIAIEFSYDLVDSETRDFLQDKARNIKKLDRRYLEDTIDSGKDLIAVKERLRDRYGHGYFMGWLKLEFPYSHEIARIRMNAARRFEGIEIPTELDFPPKIIRILSSSAKDEDQEALLKQAIEEVKNRALAGQVVTHKDAQQIVDDFKGKIADKIYIYTGKPTQGTIGGTGETINLLPKSLVYPATISLTDPTQIFVRLLESPRSAVQVKREDLELKSLCGWEVGSRAKLLSVKDKVAKPWIGEEVEVKSLEDTYDNINVAVLKQPHIHIAVKPDQLSRDIGMWRDAKGFFWVESAPPKGHEHKYIRIDTLSIEEQLNLSGQRILKCEESITDYCQHQSQLTPSSGRWKKLQKCIEKLEAEIKREREYQSLLNPSSTEQAPQNNAHKPEDKSQNSGDPYLLDSDPYILNSSIEEEKAIAQCGFKVGDWVENVGDGDRGIICELQGTKLGSPKDWFFQITATISLNSGEKIQVQTHFLRVLTSWSTYGFTWKFDAQAKTIRCSQLYWELFPLCFSMLEDDINPNQTPDSWLNEWIMVYRDRWKKILFSNNAAPLEWRNDWTKAIESIGHVKFTYRPGYKDSKEVLRPFWFEVFRDENHERKFAEFQIKLDAAYKYSHPEDWFKDEGLKMLSTQTLGIASLAGVTNARQMDAYIDQVGWTQLAQEWGKSTPQERKRIHNFYPGLRTMTKSYLGEQMWNDIQKADELYFSTQDAIATSLSQDSLVQCKTESQICRFLEVNPAGAADEFVELSWRERNHLRRLVWGFDQLLAENLLRTGLDPQVIQGLLLQDREEEIDHLKSELEALNARNLELEELNGDLNLKVANLEEQLTSYTLAM